MLSTPKTMAFNLQWFKPMNYLNIKSIIFVGLIIGNLSSAMASSSAASSFKDTEINDDVYQQELDVLSEEDAAAIDVYRSLQKIGAEKVCSSLVVNKEQEGRYYKAVEKAFKKHDLSTVLDGTKDLTAVCPKYPTLSQQEKEEVWTVILGATSFYESSCRLLGAREGGPNGQLGGPFQLHVGKEPFYGRLCKKGDALTKDENRFIPCVLSMLEKYFAKQASKGDEVKLFPQRAAGATYWEVLQSNATKHHRVTVTDAKGNKKMIRGNGSDFVKMAIKNYKYCR
ncbi:hypothetical protein ACLVWU_06565 [Bdellovibrio sp. HCB290]|uniref:hypothetical protein n=1 Tax=Bdellovibrio sp. HCB290 TaxID=3394356 RepID=UPI0039B5542C